VVVEEGVGVMPTMIKTPRKSKRPKYVGKYFQRKKMGGKRRENLGFVWGEQRKNKKDGKLNLLHSLRKVVRKNPHLKS